MVTADLAARYAAPRLLIQLPLALAAAGIASQAPKVMQGNAETGLLSKKPLVGPLLAAGAVLAPTMVRSLKGAPKAYARLLLYDREGRLLDQITQPVTKEARLR